MNCLENLIRCVRREWLLQLVIFTLFVVVVALVLECRVAVVSSQLIRVKQSLVEAGRSRGALFVLVE